MFVSASAVRKAVWGVTSTCAWVADGKVRSVEHGRRRAPAPSYSPSATARQHEHAACASRRRFASLQIPVISSSVCIRSPPRARLRQCDELDELAVPKGHAVHGLEVGEVLGVGVELGEGSATHQDWGRGRQLSELVGDGAGGRESVV